MLVFPPLIHSPVRCVCWGTFSQCLKAKMLGSHLKAVTDGCSLGLRSAIAVKSQGTSIFCCSTCLKHLAPDCQNLSHHGENNTWKCLQSTLQARKRHFPLTFRPISFIQQFVSHLVSQHVYKCVLLIDHI